MFSGIVQEIGKVVSITGQMTKTLGIEIQQSTQCKIGDSVSVNGVCLTVTQLEPLDHGMCVYFDVVAETLKKTNLASLSVMDWVNIEHAMCYGDAIGGHMVQGHVDTTGQIVQIQPDDLAWHVVISASSEFLKYVVEKGFISIDGMSLTVIDVFQTQFSITLIPHTMSHTIAQYYHQDSVVNLEADMTAKYIERYVRKYQHV